MNAKTDTVTLYRPVGKDELQLIIDSGYTKWPPRLPGQPIFYPVTNEAYAIEVNNWNIRQYGIGYITRFNVNKSFMDKYNIETVGGKNHTEWSIPAADLDELNDNISGLIEVIGEYTRIMK